ncbi:TIR domain-containing protein [Nocardia terpenica]|nr:TIR domain-containing protein [Nocardia terpenica]
MLTAQNTPPRTGPRFDAFISYRSKTSARAARQLQRALVALSKRHRPDRVLSLFLDTQSLVARELDAEIEQALANSHALIVLLARGTEESPWVDREIRYWLEHGGDLDRLFLVRHDDALNLAWDKKDGTFAEPDKLPPALTELITKERKWLDLRRSLTGTDETALVGLYAPIVGAVPEDLLLAEADFQQRRQRRNRIITTTLTVLLVLALVAGGTALVNWRKSEANRIRADHEATQARADADAAQALLAAADSPSRGIRLAVGAARLSSTSSVRAALLAVADTSAVLQHAYEFPRQDAGYPGTGVAFSYDDSQLFGWGHATDRDDSYLVGWDLVTGRRQVAMRLPVPGLAAVAAVSPRWVAGCSAAGPVLITPSNHDVRKLAAEWPRERTCALHTFAGGMVITTQNNDGTQGKSYFVNHVGQVGELDGMSSVAVRHEAPAAIVAGPAGIAVLRADGVTRLGDQPVRTADILDNAGGFAVRADDRRWILGHPNGSGYTLTESTASADAVDSAPQLTLEGLTGELAEVTADGTVRMSHTIGTAQVHGNGRLAKFDFVTRIVPVMDAFVVVYRDGASMVWPPGKPAFAPLANDLLRDQWRAVPSGWSQGSDPSGRDAVVGGCQDHEKVYLASDPGSPGIWTVDPDHLAREVRGYAATGVNCGVVDTADGLEFTPRLDLGHGPQILRRSPVFDGLAVSADETKIAVIQADQPVEVLSATGAANKPWGARQYIVPQVSTALEEQRLIIGFGTITAVSRDGTIRQWPATDRSDVLAVHPAGQEVLARYSGPEKRALIVGASGPPVEANTYCAIMPAKYVPSPGFQTSPAAAARPVLVADTENGPIDCRTGRSVPTIKPDHIVDYGIGADTGRILWRDDRDDLRITEWRTRGSGIIRTRPVPSELARPGAHVVVSGESLIGIAAGEGLLRIYSDSGSGWQPQSAIPVMVQNIIGVSVADQGNLALVTAADGSFELYDVATGRRVVTNHVPLGTSRFERISAYESDGFLTALLYQKDEPAAHTTIEIPITTPLLVDQLCTTYTAPECAQPDR